MATADTPPSSRFSGASRPANKPRPRPTISDVAERAGVSKGAVSFALNGGSGVSEATRKRIIRAAEELSWRPSTAARALSRARADAVGLVLNRPLRTVGVEPFFTQFISGLTASLARHGRGLQIFIVDNAEDELATYRSWWEQRHVDAFVVLDPVNSDPRIAFLAEGDVPGVVVGVPADTDRLATVWSDDALAMERAVHHLRGLGHSRIAHIGGIPGLRHVDVRADAFAAACDVSNTFKHTRPTDFTEAEAAAAMAALLADPTPPTAVIFDSDVMALAGLGVALDAGLVVPGQLSLVSMDDSVMVRLAHPAITAMSRDTVEFGITTADAVGELLDNQHVVRLECPTPRLEVRGTSAVAPSAATRRARPAPASGPVLLPSVQVQRIDGRTHGSPQRVRVADRRICIPTEHDQQLADLAASLTSEPALSGSRVVSSDEPMAAGDIGLQLRAPGPDDHPDGYSIIESGTDPSGVRPIVLSAATIRGLFLGSRTLLQALGQNRPIGELHDWPRYAERGVLLDIARKYFSPSWITGLLQEMAALKLNTLQLHVSEGTGFGVECRSHPEITTGRKVLSYGDITQIVRVAHDLHIDVNVDIDSPAHLDHVLNSFPDFRLRLADGTIRRDVLDFSIPQARRLVTEIIDEMGELFDGPVVHLGGDEVFPAPWQRADDPVLSDDLALSDDPRLIDDPGLISDRSAPQWVAYAQQITGQQNATARDGYLCYLNSLAEHVRSLGRTARIWNDEVGLGDRVAAIDPEVEIDHWIRWNRERPTAGESVESGHRIINSHGDYLYFILTPGGVGDGPNKNPRRIYERWSPHTFMGVAGATSDEILADDVPVQGAHLSVWCDAADAMTEEEIGTALSEWLQAFAQQIWGAPQRYPSWTQLRDAVRPWLRSRAH